MLVVESDTLQELDPKSEHSVQWKSLTHKKNQNSYSYYLNWLKANFIL